MITAEEVSALRNKDKENKDSLEYKRLQEIQRVKQLFIVHNKQNMDNIKSSIEWAISVGKTYTSPTYLSLSREICKKECVMFETEAVRELLKDAGFTKLCNMKAFYHNHNAQYFTINETTPVNIDEKRSLDITIHYKKHHWFFWRPVEIRVYFSLYIGDL